MGASWKKDGALSWNLPPNGARRVRNLGWGRFTTIRGVLKEHSPIGSVAPATPKEHWKDGTYTGWGFSPHGDIEAAVRIEGGRGVQQATGETHDGHGQQSPAQHDEREETVDG